MVQSGQTSGKREEVTQRVKSEQDDTNERVRHDITLECRNIGSQVRFWRNMQWKRAKALVGAEETPRD